jgi:hypothetical protein
VHAGDSAWFPSASPCAWGEIRAAGIGPSPGTLHFNGTDRYELYPGPDALAYPAASGIGLLMTNVLRLDSALREVLEEDGAKRQKARTGFVVHVDFRDDDDGEQECPLARAWLLNKAGSLAEASGPTSERVFYAVAYLKRMTAEGHFTRAVVEDTQEELPLDADWDAIWERTEVNPSPEPTDCDCLDEEDED